MQESDKFCQKEQFIRKTTMQPFRATKFDVYPPCFSMPNILPCSVRQNAFFHPSIPVKIAPKIFQSRSKTHHWKEHYIVRKWSKDTIAEEIRRLKEGGEDMNYSNIAQNQVALLRAATRYFGSWRAAVDYAGLDYEDIRRYKTWTKERIVERIKQLHADGEDLSWRHVSTAVDPQLAAAATKRKHFGSWRGAVVAAGLDYKNIRRYREWDKDTIIKELQDLHAKGVDLNAKSIEEHDITLITAARRRFDSWDRALTAAGLDYRKIVLRTPFKRRRQAEIEAAADAHAAEAAKK